MGEGRGGRGDSYPLAGRLRGRELVEGELRDPRSVATGDARKTTGMVSQGAPWTFRWKLQTGPSLFIFLFSFISFQQLI